MAVTVHVAEVLRRYAGGCETVAVDGADVRSALGRLFVRHPGLEARVLRPDGTLWPYLVLFRNDREIPRGGTLDVPLADGDTLEIVGAAEGG